MAHPDPAVTTWMDLFDQLQAARARHKLALETGGVAPPELVDEVARLKRLSGVALDRVIASQQNGDRFAPTP